MTTKHACLSALVVAAGLAAQGTATFPSDYVGVAEGPLNSNNLPLANGTGRVLVVYDQWDLQVPPGSAITRISFRQDSTTITMDSGRTLQLEIRMGYTSRTSAGLDYDFDANFVAPPVTVFGPALLSLPNLRDSAAPLPNGRVAIDLTTPFVYQPGADNLLVEYRIHGNSGGGTAWSYRLDRADYYSPVVNGPAGCQHSGGQVPTLTLSAVRCGSQFTANIARAPGGSFAALMITVGTPLVPPYALGGLVPGIAPQCTGQIALPGAATIPMVTTSAGNASLSFAVPNQRVPFYGMVFGAQGAFLDPFAPGSVVVSNGAQVQVGIKPASSILFGAGPPSTVVSGSQLISYCPVVFFDYQ